MWDNHLGCVRPIHFEDLKAPLELGLGRRCPFFLHVDDEDAAASLGGVRLGGRSPKAKAKAPRVRLGQGDPHNAVVGGCRHGLGRGLGFCHSGPLLPIDHRAAQPDSPAGARLFQCLVLAAQLRILLQHEDGNVLHALQHCDQASRGNERRVMAVKLHQLPAHLEVGVAVGGRAWFATTDEDPETVNFGLVIVFGATEAQAEAIGAFLEPHRDGVGANGRGASRLVRHIDEAVVLGQSGVLALAHRQPVASGGKQRRQLGRSELGGVGAVELHHLPANLEILTPARRGEGIHAGHKDAKTVHGGLFGTAPAAETHAERTVLLLHHHGFGLVGVERRPGHAHRLPQQLSVCLGHRLVVRELQFQGLADPLERCFELDEGEIV